MIVWLTKPSRLCPTIAEPTVPRRRSRSERSCDSSIAARAGDHPARRAAPCSAATSWPPRRRFPGRAGELFQIAASLGDGALGRHTANTHVLAADHKHEGERSGIVRVVDESLGDRVGISPCDSLRCVVLIDVNLTVPAMRDGAITSSPRAGPPDRLGPSELCEVGAEPLRIGPDLRDQGRPHDRALLLLVVPFE